MLMHPLQTESIARSRIDDRHRATVSVEAVPRVGMTRRAGTAFVGAAAVLDRIGRSLEGTGRVDPVVDLRPCS